MRIGIDGRLVSYRRGMGNWVYNLLATLSELCHKHEFVIYINSPASCKQLLGAEQFQVRVLWPGSYVLSEQWALPAQAARDRLDILHCPANTAPLKLPGRIQLVLTVHDVMYLLPKAVLPLSPSPYQRWGRIYRRLVVPRVAKRAVVITTVSNYSERDIVRYLRVPSERVRVIHEAASRAFRLLSNKDAIDEVKRSYGIRDRFVMALGGIDPRKNTVGVIRAFGCLKQMSGFPHQLVVVGLPSNVQRKLANLTGQMGLEEQVTFTGFVPEEDLVALYNGAELFLYPSLYEGFGLPVLEAMACGTPVISSPRGSIPEVAADAALLVSPTDINALAKAMIQLITDGTLRKTLIARGFEQAGKFSWEKAAKEILKVYEECPRG